MLIVTIGYPVSMQKPDQNPTGLYSWGTSCCGRDRGMAVVSQFLFSLLLLDNSEISKDTNHSLNPLSGYGTFLIWKNKSLFKVKVTCTSFLQPGCRGQHLSLGQLLLLQCLQLPPKQYGAYPQDLQHTGWHAEGHTRHQRYSDVYTNVSLHFSNAVNEGSDINHPSYLSLQRSLFMVLTSLVRSLPWKLISCTSYQAFIPPLGKHSPWYVLKSVCI